MQGMDIMAMIQKSSMVKQKSNTVSFGNSLERTSFKRELAEARKSTFFQSQENNATDSVKQAAIVKENRVEKLSKIMSGSKVITEKTEKTEKTENALEVETVNAQETVKLEQVNEANPAINVEKPVEDEVKLEEDTPLRELLESTEEVLQQLMQLISSTNTEAVPKENVKQIEETLKAVTQKLEQLISKPVEVESEDASIILKDLKVEIKELLKQLKTKGNEVQTTVKDKPSLLQTVNTIKHLINKMNEIKPELLQKLNKAEIMQVHAEQKLDIPKSEKTTDSKEIKKADGKETEIKPLVENVKLKPVAEESVKDNLDKYSKQADKEDNEVQDKTELKQEAKPVTTVDKSSTVDVKTFVIPQDDKSGFQIHMKEINLNVKKEQLVSINKSDIVNQVIKKADIILSEGHSEMIMKLEPESLGKLNLKIVVEKGLITAKFVAESQQVKEVLESSFNQLKDALQEKGIAVQSFSVSVGQQAGNSSSNQSFNQWKQSIKLKSKSLGEFMELDDESVLSQNPYSYHEGKIDYRA